jgi:hypothetical protein
MHAAAFTKALRTYPAQVVLSQIIQDLFCILRAQQTEVGKQPFIKMPPLQQAADMLLDGILHLYAWHAASRIAEYSNRESLCLELDTA